MSIADAIAESFEVTLPEVVVDFLEDEPDERVLSLKKGFLRGTFEVDFGAEELANLEELCEVQWIDEGDTLAEEWKETFGQLVPLALLTDEDADSDSDPVKSFLAVDAGNPKAPVYVWDSDGWMVYLLASSFEDFLAGKAPARNALAKIESTIVDKKHVSKVPYEAYEWSDEEDDDDDDDDDEDEEDGDDDE